MMLVKVGVLKFLIFCAFCSVAVSFYVGASREDRASNFSQDWTDSLGGGVSGSVEPSLSAISVPAAGFPILTDNLIDAVVNQRVRPGSDVTVLLEVFGLPHLRYPGADGVEVLVWQLFWLREVRLEVSDGTVKSISIHYFAIE